MNCFIFSWDPLILKRFIIILCIPFYLFSCKSSEKAIYFQNITHDTIIKSVVNPNFEPKIKRNDVLMINISSINTEASLPFNVLAVPTLNLSGNSVPGYTVDTEGNIYLLYMGKLHVEGMTTKELKILLEKLLISYLKDPIVTVKYINQKITVFGEVTKPFVIPVNNKVSIIDAITLSGGILPTGNKENILLIRETDSGRVFKKLNLKSSSIISSPYFYLEPNDVIYVEPKTRKIYVSPETVQLVNVGLSTISFLILILRGFK